jgi:hypothetical protein
VDLQQLFLANLQQLFVVHLQDLFVVHLQRLFVVHLHDLFVPVLLRILDPGFQKKEYLINTSGLKYIYTYRDI